MPQLTLRTGRIIAKIISVAAFMLSVISIIRNRQQGVEIFNQVRSGNFEVLINQVASEVHRLIVLVYETGKKIAENNVLKLHR